MGDAFAPPPSAGMDASNPFMAAPAHQRPHAAPQGQPAVQAVWNPAATPAAPATQSQPAFASAPAPARAQPPSAPAPIGSPWGGGAFGDSGTQAVLVSAATDMMKNRVESVLVQWVPGLKALWATSRFFFAVDSSYVARKLAILAFPWTRKDWSRKWDTVPVEGAPGATEARDKPPVADPNAPDLYIPTMALVTFILAVGLVKGVEMQFSPDVLSKVTTSCIVTSLLETAVVYAGVYTTLSSTRLRGAGFVDLLALAGYKYVGLVAALVVGLLAGDIPFYAVLLYSAASSSFALSKWLAAACAGLRLEMQGTARLVTLGAPALQILVMFWLAQH